jgi:glycosyltransferase involved in cell wall biosynthesis
LGVREFHTDIFQQVAEHFGAPLFSFTTDKALWEELCFVVALNRIVGPLHLSNHHLGRYGVFLRSLFIVTVHDLMRYLDLTTNVEGDEPLIHRPNLRDRAYLKFDYLGIRRAVHLIATSRHTKTSLVKHLGVPEEKTSVVYNGIDHDLYRPVCGPSPVHYPYVLYVGTEQPRKYLRTLLRAFSWLKQDRRFGRLKLVKIGKAGGPEADFRGRTLEEVERLGLGRDVVFTGYVPRERMPHYYSRAECLALPSLYEGFGLTPLEAMSCGCPVVSSNAGAIPEVVGDAALTVDPLDEAALASALGNVLTDEARRKEMIARGQNRASLFSWEKAARVTLQVYERVQEGIGRSSAILSL